MTSPQPEPTRAAPPVGTDTRAPVHLGYETRDVNIRAILYLVLGILAGAAVVHVSLWFLLQQYEAVAKRSDPQLSPLAEERLIPPGPRLQNKPLQDYRDYRAEQEELLNSYGWTDKSQGVVRIPVSRAMDLLLEQGLPEPKAQEPGPEAPEGDKESNSSDPPSQDEPEPQRGNE